MNINDKVKFNGNMCDLIGCYISPETSYYILKESPIMTVKWLDSGRLNVEVTIEGLNKSIWLEDRLLGPHIEEIKPKKGKSKKKDESK